MARAKYLRGWLLAPLVLGAGALIASLLFGSEPLPDPVVSVVVYLMLGFVFGGIPYALGLAFVWQLLPAWRPWTARLVTICYPWVWLWAGSMLLTLGHSEHQAADRGFPWMLAVAVFTWAVVVVGLERAFVGRDSQFADA